MKDKLRKEFLNKRNNLNKELVDKSSLNIIAKLEKLDIFKKYNNIAIYYPIGNEINLLELTKKYNNLVFPKYDKNNFDMNFYYTDSNNFTNEVLLEDKIVLKDDIDVIIVPGIIFDKKNNRMGFGKGYYDRYLKDFKGIKIGVCCKEFILDNIPSLNHDIKMDYILCDS